MTAGEAAGLIIACFDGVTGVTRGPSPVQWQPLGRPVYGAPRIAPWVPVLQRLDGVIDSVLLEASYFSECNEREALKDVPKSMRIAAGIVDEANFTAMPVRKAGRGVGRRGRRGPPAAVHIVSLRTACAA